MYLGFRYDRRSGVVMNNEFLRMNTLFVNFSLQTLRFSQAPHIALTSFSKPFINNFFHKNMMK